jgi:hypothetical protein
LYLVGRPGWRLAVPAGGDTPGLPLPCRNKVPGDPMSFNDYVAHVAECEQRAKTARTAEDKHSWLAMAESWRKSAELRLILERQDKFIHKTAAPASQV